MTSVTCETCGKAFEKVAAQARRSKLHYCSRACRNLRVALTCEHCGTAFVRKQSDIANRPSRWCSRACADIGRRAGETRTCDYCGVAFYLYPSHARAIPGRFCSIACYHASGEVAERMRKPKGPEFGRRLSEAKNKGGSLYRGYNWRGVADAIRERDGHTCQHCGKHQTEPVLDVHHIVPFAAFDDIDAANDPANLVTLCNACHTAADNRAGRPNGRRPRKGSDLFRLAVPVSPAE